MAVPVRLKVFKGDELVATRDFERDMIKIGRLATAHLCVEDDKVSRIHSVINVEGDGKLSIVDMGSTEGTYLNGKRVSKGSVAFGDEIRIGNTRIVVEAPGAEATNVVENVARPNEITQVSELPKLDAAPPPPPPAAATAQATYTAPSPQVMAAPPPPPPGALETPTQPFLDEQLSAAELGMQEDPGDGEWQGMITEGRHRIFRLHEKPFQSYVAEKPAARRAKGDGKLGLQVRFYWGDTLLGVVQHDEPRDVKVGSTGSCDLHIESDAWKEHTLVKKGSGGFEVVLGDGMSGELDRDGKVTKLSGGSHELRPKDFAWVELSKGGVRAELSFAVQPKKVVVPVAESIDYRFLNMFLLLAFVVGAFAITAQMQTDADIVADDLSMNKLVVAKFILKDAEKPKHNALLDKLEASKVAAKQPGEQAQKHKDEEGKMGKKEAAENKKNRSAPKAIDINAKELVKNSGILKSLGGGGGGLSTIFGQGGLGGDLKGALGNMFGSQVGDAHGFGGLGLKGTAGGGGGIGQTIGIGGIGTKGRGGGLAGYGTGVGTLGGKKATDVGIADSESTVSGSLDKELIRKVIRDNIQKIRYCYEKELQVKPNLAGKVSVRFIIAPNGDVMSAKVAEGSTLTDAALGECITVRVRSFKFPSPKGGGNVIVTYPFVFKQSGE